MDLGWGKLTLPPFSFPLYRNVYFKAESCRNHALQTDNHVSRMCDPNCCLARAQRWRAVPDRQLDKSQNHLCNSPHMHGITQQAIKTKKKSLGTSAIFCNTWGKVMSSVTGQGTISWEKATIWESFSVRATTWKNSYVKKKIVIRLFPFPHSFLHCSSFFITGGLGEEGGWSIQTCQAWQVGAERKWVVVDCARTWMKWNKGE